MSSKQENVGKNGIFLYNGIFDMLLSVISVCIFWAILYEIGSSENGNVNLNVLIGILELWGIVSIYPIITALLLNKNDLFRLIFALPAKFIISNIACFGISRICRALFTSGNFSERLVKGGIGTACFYVAIGFVRR